MSSAWLKKKPETAPSKAPKAKNENFLADISARREPKALKAGFTFSDGFRLGFGFGIGFLLVCVILAGLSWGILVLSHH